MLRTVGVLVLFCGGASGLRIKQVENYGLSSLYNGLASEYNQYMFEDPNSRGEVHFTAQKTGETPLERGEKGKEACYDQTAYPNMAKCNGDAECTWSMTGAWFVGQADPPGMCVPTSARGKCRYDPAGARAPCECLNTSTSCGKSTECSWLDSNTGCVTTCYQLYNFPKDFNGERSQWQWACENNKNCEFCSSSGSPRCEPNEYCVCMSFDSDKAGCKLAVDKLGKKLCTWGWNGDEKGCYGQAEVLAGASMMCYDAGVTSDSTICGGVKYIFKNLGIEATISRAKSILPQKQADRFEQQTIRAITNAARGADRIRRRFRLPAVGGRSARP